MFRGGERHGQASVELLAVVPLVLVLALALAQCAVAGYALLSAGEAARAGARANHVGADFEDAARAALPGFLDASDVSQAGAEVRVEVEAPALIPGFDGIPVRAAAALDPAGGGP